MDGFNNLPIGVQRAIISRHNINTSEHFAEFVGAFVLFFVLLRLAHLFTHKYGRKVPVAAAVIAAPARVLRPLLLRRLPGLISRGHALIYVVYILANVALAVSERPADQPISSRKNWFAKRFGW
jgi:hypothetical protein